MRSARLPGVAAAASSTHVPLSGSIWSHFFRVTGTTGTAQGLTVRLCQPGLLRDAEDPASAPGRDFDALGPCTLQARHGGQRKLRSRSSRRPCIRSARPFRPSPSLDSRRRPMRSSAWLATRSTRICGTRTAGARRRVDRCRRLPTCRLRRIPARMRGLPVIVRSELPAAASARRSRSRVAQLRPVNRDRCDRAEDSIPRTPDWRTDRRVARRRVWRPGDGARRRSVCTASWPTWR